MSTSLDRGIEKNTFLHFKNDEDFDEPPQLRRVLSWPGTFSEISTTVTSSCDSSLERTNSMEIPNDDMWSILTQEDEVGQGCASPFHTLYDYRVSWADIEDDCSTTSMAFGGVQSSNTTASGTSTTASGNQSRDSVTTVSVSSTTGEVGSPTSSSLSQGKDVFTPYAAAGRRESAEANQFEVNQQPKYRQVRISGTKQRPPQTVFMSEAPWTEVLPVRKRNPSKMDKYGRSRVAPPPKDTRMVPKYLCTYFVGIEDGPEFTVAKRIIGPQGRNMKYIADEAQGSKIRLRGKGSMFRERETGYESKEPLQINISVTGRMGYKRAKELVAQLLREIYFEYYKMFGELVELSLLEDPRNPPN